MTELNRISTIVKKESYIASSSLHFPDKIIYSKISRIKIEKNYCLLYSFIDL